VSMSWLRRSREPRSSAKEPDPPAGVMASEDLVNSDIDWRLVETAYGSARNIPALLACLAGDDHAAAMAASHDLWCALCHQHAYVSSAALPALPALLFALDRANEELAVEILDILTGFAVCTSLIAKNEAWMNALRARLQEELSRFLVLAKSKNELIAEFASGIADNLRFPPMPPKDAAPIS
jgi:hypothetical protein